MLAALLAAALTFTPADARFALETAGAFVSRHTPRDAGTLRGRLAAGFVLDAARAAGADARLDHFTAATPKGERAFTNVTAEFVSNPTGRWVVVVSHFDTKPGTGCPGANDGASTTGLLVALAGRLAAGPAGGGNVMLLWTDGEECLEAYTDTDGLQGSRHAAAALRASGRDVAAVICADMLGDRDLHVTIPRNTTEALRKVALAAAAEAGLDGLVAESPGVVKDDHVPFADLGFPVLELIDFRYGSAPGANDYWHTPADTVDKLAEESLLKSGRLLAGIIDLLLLEYPQFLTP